MFERLHHMQLAIPRGHEAPARAFYAGVLGLAEVDKPPVLAARGAPGSGLVTSSCTSASRTSSDPPVRATRASS